jgi:hypothetical protein
MLTGAVGPAGFRHIVKTGDRARRMSAVGIISDRGETADSDLQMIKVQDGDSCY